MCAGCTTSVAKGVPMRGRRRRRASRRLGALARSATLNLAFSSAWRACCWCCTVVSSCLGEGEHDACGYHCGCRYDSACGACAGGGVGGGGGGGATLGGGGAAGPGAICCVVCGALPRRDLVTGCVACLALLHWCGAPTLMLQHCGDMRAGVRCPLGGGSAAAVPQLCDVPVGSAARGVPILWEEVCDGDPSRRRALARCARVPELCCVMCVYIMYCGVSWSDVSRDTLLWFAQACTRLRLARRSTSVTRRSS